jgi:hypothetical protein
MHIGVECLKLWALLVGALGAEILVSRPSVGASQLERRLPKGFSGDNAHDRGKWPGPGLLERINELFDFEMLRPDLEAAVPGFARGAIELYCDPAKLVSCSHFQIGNNAIEYGTPSTNTHSDIDDGKAPPRYRRLGCGCGTRASSGTRKAAVRALHFWHFPRAMRNMDAGSGIASAEVERSTA